MTTKRKILIAAGVIVVLAIVGSVASSGGDDKADSAAKTAPPPAPEAPPPPPPPAADTGRMSEGEFDIVQRYWDGFVDENTQMGEGLAKCGVLFEAGALADGSDCVGEAYSGFDTKASALYFGVEELQGDVGRACLRRTKQFLPTLDRYWTAAKNTAKGGELLQVDQVTFWAGRMANESSRVIRLKGLMDEACRPI